MDTHDERIVDQFTKQAPLFQAIQLSAEEAIHQAVTVSGVTSADTVLDVACGPGVLACAFAKVASHITGIDITPTMLEQARRLQTIAQIENVSWQLGDVNRLPFEDKRFSMIISRYAFHHFEQPEAVLKEMWRVCKPGGQVVIIDSAPAPEKAVAFNKIERKRDPSHTKALTNEEISQMMAMQGLAVTRRHLYSWEVSAEGLLARSFPAEGDRERILRIYEGDVGQDRLGMNAHRIEGALYVTFPTLITVGYKL